MNTNAGQITQYYENGRINIAPPHGKAAAIATIRTLIARGAHLIAQAVALQENSEHIMTITVLEREAVHIQLARKIKILPAI